MTSAVENHLHTGPVVALAGDWHGNTPWGTQRLADLGAAGIATVLHLGDFGIRSDRAGKRYLTKLDESCAEHDITLYVTPGNHEDWARLGSKKARVRDTMGPLLWLTDRIAVLPRGHRFWLITPTGTRRSVVSLGGAPSIDRHTRTEGRTWWPEEMITEDDVTAVAAGGYADVMLAHDAPDHPYQTGPVATICVTNPGGFPADALSYCARGRNRMTRAFEAVSPAVFAHGHYHVRADAQVSLPNGNRCQVVSLAADTMSGNVARLNLDTLHVS